MGKLAALLKALSGHTLEERERKLLELEADANITALVPELVYEQIVAGAEEALCMRDVLRKSTIRMDRPEMKITVWKRPSRVLPQVGDVGAYPNATIGDFNVVTLSAKKYGEIVPISQDLIEDSLFDLVEMLLREEGRIAENTLNQVAIDEIVKNASHSHDWNNTQPVKAIAEAVSDVKGDNFTPDTLILTPEALADMFMDEHFTYQYIGEAGNIRSQELKQPILGMKVYVLGYPTSYFDYASGKKVAVVMDSQRAAILGIRENITTDRIEDPLNDLINLKVWMRFDVKVIWGGAIAVLNYA